jgi:hypothetical protein
VAAAEAVEEEAASKAVTEAAEETREAAQAT